MYWAYANKHLEGLERMFLKILDGFGYVLYLVFAKKLALEKKKSIIDKFGHEPETPEFWLNTTFFITLHIFLYFVA